MSWWERRDAADRDALGRAALDHCRALRQTEGLRAARFYWLGPDTLVLVEDVESLDVPSTPRQHILALGHFWCWRTEQGERMAC